MASERLTKDEIAQRQSAAPDWAADVDRLQRTFVLPDFVRAMAFAMRVAFAAESANHHPDIMIRYNKLTFTLSTHDAGGVTGKDFSLAAEIDSISKTA